MPTIDGLFKVHRARSGLYSEYEPGPVGYVGNTTSDNGIVGFVTPREGDRVFTSRAIAVSAFCDATIHVPPFIACGRAGNGLIVLEPRTTMTPGTLAYYAAFINISVKWRFNWYRQVTADRLRGIKIPSAPEAPHPFAVSRYVPTSTRRERAQWDLKTEPFALESLFELQPGDYHSLSDLEPGDVPVVSCGNEDNGVAGLYSVTKHIYRGRLTIALNGSPLTAKYHAYSFAAKDDVAVCTPRRPLTLTSVLFIQSVLEMERWRYSYYRKCYMSKLKRFTIGLPASRGTLDEDAMRRVVERTPYWQFLSTALVAAHDRKKQSKVSLA